VERFLLLFVTLLLAFSHDSPASAGMKGGKNVTGNIHWLGHDTFKITGEKTIYTDPFTISRKDRADIILITHEHYDHCSPDDVKKLQGPDTVIIATADCARKLTGNIRTIRPGDTVTIGKTAIEAVPAYNTNKKFHPRDKGWVGYLFTVNGKRIYLAGDTDLIPEMKTIKVDIALIPVSGTYVMTAEEAAQAALTIHPQVAIPMHYGSIVGSASDAKKFQEKLLGKIDVVILPKE
jgi:L-ascorbate metabolism protein UlaG (beta-lactamase superfamily)